MWKTYHYGLFIYNESNLEGIFYFITGFFFMIKFFFVIIVIAPAAGY